MINPNQFTERSFDKVYEIFQNMSDEHYELTRHAAYEFYHGGKTSLLSIAATATNLSGDEILKYWYKEV